MDKKKLALLKLQKNLIAHFPEKYLPIYVNNIKDVYVHRKYLVNVPCADFVVSHIVNLISDALINKIRFRTLDCLKIIRSIIRNKPDFRLSSEVVSALFGLYKNFIFDKRDKVQWCVSTFIKNRELKNEEILWLIENYHRSSHLVNRLLRYPKYHQMIARWALKLYKKGELSERISELIAVMISDEIPPEVGSVDKEKIIWAVYYSTSSDTVKIKQLKGLVEANSIDELIEVCKRLDYPSVLRHAIKQLSL